MEHILEINNLNKKFREFELKDLNIKMDKGYIMGFIGPNGAGKSTTIKLIMNLLKKDSGEIKVFGMDNIIHEKEIKNRIGFVMDESHFYEELTVTETKRIISPFYKDWDDKTFNKYLKGFGISPAKRIKELSKGMKMKLSLAIALSHNAQLLIMDEPTSGLDPIVRSELLEILADLIQDENKGVFFSTHITSDLDKIADYITFINEGRIIFSASKDDILEKYGLVKGAKEILDNETKQLFVGIKENKYGFEGLAKDKHEVKKILGEKAVVEKPSLDDIMLYFTRRTLNV
ncbi:MAG: ABC transporter ATP-binding protein [Clostridiales bacterium]|nr:ABC transporter ATP-binding protein [Clostridiales bacterium]